MIFSKEEIKYIEDKGLTLNQVEEQIELFKKGIPFVNLKEAATIGNGILSLNDQEANYFCDAYEDRRNSISITKFVPASGAATRMFKFLFKFLERIRFNKRRV